MQKFLKPTEGALLRDPYTFTALPLEGGYVDWNGNSGRYWRRRVRDGSASIVKPVAAVKTTSTKKKQGGKE